jgi:hypothetical protein
MALPQRRLGPVVVTLIVIDVVLVLVVAILLVTNAARSRDGTATSDGSPVGDAAVTFASPTRNITCAIYDASARCEIAQFQYETPTLDGCSGDVGHEIEVTADGARWICRTDSPPPPPAPEIADLDWGDSTAANGFTCMSTGNGVTCTHDESSHFFHLERHDVTLG